MMFGGDPILTLEDAMDAASELSSSHIEYYIASYKKQSIKSVDEHNFFLTADTWMSIINGELGKDEGTTQIEVTMLE